ncbi:MAG: Fe-S cluster assembly ATPase SufC [Acidimicrobiia bacterium]
MFEVAGLHASVDGHEILHGVDLEVGEGEFAALMGPNGSGKSTLANVLMGNGAYEVTSGRIRFRGDDVTGLGPDERGRRGIFLGFQYPQELPGVKMLNLMQTAMSRRRGIDLSLLEIRLSMMEKMEALGMDREFMDRHLNQGYSGGEKKRNEILQMALLEPDFAILDETDSGLDVDALRVVSDGISTIRARRPSMSALVITHYKRILEHLHPDTVHVLVDGRIVASGTAALAAQVDADGFDAYRNGAPKRAAGAPL